MDGMEYILSAFEYERDKIKALGVLQTVRKQNLICGRTVS